MFFYIFFYFMILCEWFDYLWFDAHQIFVLCLSPYNETSLICVDSIVLLVQRVGLWPIAEYEYEKKKKWNFWK